MNSSPNYQTRPSKHVERKIFVEALQHLRGAGYKISTYRYLGFGSFYYMDFILFHRLLSIKKMTCLEKRTGISRRMKFNKPFKFIELEMKDIASYLPKIKEKEKHIVWLDYECQLNSDVLATIGTLVGTLANESVLIITVNAQADMTSEESEGKKSKTTTESLKQKHEQELSPFSGEIKKDDITGKGLPLLFIRSIRSRIIDALKSRLDDDFYQVFNYVYRDGARMLTFGGVIDSKDKKEKIMESLKDLKSVNLKNDPREIFIPPLTMREKLLLDKKINKNNTAHDLPFELEPEEIRGYIEYSSHYPTFHEVFMN